MGNVWIQKKKQNDKLEEAKVALHKWCNKTSYDDFGMYVNTKVSNWDKPMESRRKFFREYPEYKEFEMDLRITWNLHHVDHPTRRQMSSVADPCDWPNDASGIPDVTVYPEGYWERCAEIAKRAIPNYYHKKEGKVWTGDHIAKAINKATCQNYLRLNGIYNKDVDAQQHLTERQRKFWNNVYESGSIVAGFGEDD